MAEQTKKGFHAFEDRVHQIEEEEKHGESSAPRQGKDDRPQRESPRPKGGEESPSTRK